MNARSHGRVLIALVAFALAAAPVAPAAAVNGVFAEQVARLHASDGVQDDWFGDCVDIDGDVAVIGAPGDDSQRGSAYVYERTATGWAYRQKLTASPVRTAGDSYGAAVAVSGEFIVVGAPNQADGATLQAGHVYVYRRISGNWTLVYDNSSPAPHASDQFGWSVAIDGNTFVVGEPGLDSVYGPDHGMAFVYRWNGTVWSPTQYLEDINPGVGNAFGRSVAISGTDIVVGAPGDTSSRGSFLVFHWNGSVFNFQQKVYVAGGLAGDRLGEDVDISGNTIVAGAYGRDLMAGIDAGAAYIYVNPGDAWEWRTSLVSPGPGEYQGFGFGVGIDGDIVAIGEFQGSSGAGAAHFYRRSGTLWLRVQSTDMSAANPAVRMFGCSTAVSKGTMIVGSYLASAGTATEPGGAFIYSHLVPVYRFYNAGFGTHFYTPSATERDMVIVTWPHIYNYEGVAYKVNPENNGQPLYRFYKPSSSSHFYTASVAEKNHVIATWPHIYTYEGQTYAVTPAPSAGLPIYRFYNVLNGSHFYTVSAAEKAHVQATWPHIYTYEGIAFWLGQ